jgi:hypothetical protein
MGLVLRVSHFLSVRSVKTMLNLVRLVESFLSNHGFLKRANELSESGFLLACGVHPSQISELVDNVTKRVVDERRVEGGALIKRRLTFLELRHKHCFGW